MSDQRTPRDHNRADARKAVDDARRAFGLLAHLAIAGTIHATEEQGRLYNAMAAVVTAESAVQGLLLFLGEAAMQLPDDGTDPPESEPAPPR